MDNSAIDAVFRESVGRWTGCHWLTQFGSRKLNLKGLKASQAVMIARSTAGEERECWHAAAEWLEQVETDARQSEQEARLAASLASGGQFEQALDHVVRACELEEPYHTGRVWQRLRETIGNLLHSAEGGPACPAEGVAEECPSPTIRLSHKDCT
jgi:hypothetical protein